MNRSKCHQELTATSACTKRMMEATKGIVQNYRNGGMNDWEVGADFIGMVKTNTKGFCKETI